MSFYIRGDDAFIIYEQTPIDTHTRPNEKFLFDDNDDYVEHGRLFNVSAFIFD